MNRVVMIWLALLVGSAMRCLFAQPIVWQQSFGGDRHDFLSSMGTTADGGYILGGYSSSSTNGNKTSPNYGSFDSWVIRLDGRGNKLWERTFGGTNWDQCSAVAVTHDAGVVLAGRSASPPSGNKTSAYFGAGDGWLVRLDGDGNTLWDLSFGGTNGDWFQAVAEMADGGLLVGGSSNSDPSGNKTSPNYGGVDFWVLCLDASGNKLWESSFGTNDGAGPRDEFLYGLVPTSDGGCVLGGESRSQSGSDKKGWLVRVDASGRKLWDRFYSVDNFFQTRPLRALSGTRDGGLLLGGWFGGNSVDGKTWEGFYWVTRTDADGNELWVGKVPYAFQTPPTAFGAVQELPDGGVIFSVPSAGTPYGFFGQDYLVVRLSSSGKELWRISLGGTNDDYPTCLALARDGGLIVGGYSQAAPSVNKTTPAYGGYDYWVVKLPPEIQLVPLTPPDQVASQGMRLNLSVLVPGTYATDRATSLLDWQCWQTNQITGTNAELLDGDVVPARFYRARRLP